MLLPGEIIQFHQFGVKSPKKSLKPKAKILICTWIFEKKTTGEKAMCRLNSLHRQPWKFAEPFPQPCCPPQPCSEKKTTSIRERGNNLNSFDSKHGRQLPRIGSSSPFWGQTLSTPKGAHVPMGKSNEDSETKLRQKNSIHGSKTEIGPSNLYHPCVM